MIAPSVSHTHSTFAENRETVVAVEHRSIDAHLQGAWLAGSERQKQFVRRKTTKLFELDPFKVVSACRNFSGGVSFPSTPSL